VNDTRWLHFYRQCGYTTAVASSTAAARSVKPLNDIQKRKRYESDAHIRVHIRLQHTPRSLAAASTAAMGP